MKLKEKMAIAIAIILAVAFVFHMATLDNRNWNNGKCSDCGVAWEFVKEVPAHGANEGAEIWQCPNCHKTITLGASKEVLGWIYIALDAVISIGIYKGVFKIINQNKRRKNMKKEFVKGIAATYAAKIIATLAGTASVAMALFGISLIDPNATFVANITTGVACGLITIICGKIAVVCAKQAIKLEKKY